VTHLALFLPACSPWVPQCSWGGGEGGGVARRVPTCLSSNPFFPEEADERRGGEKQFINSRRNDSSHGFDKIFQESGKGKGEGRKHRVAAVRWRRRRKAIGQSVKSRFPVDGEYASEYRGIVEKEKG